MIPFFTLAGVPSYDFGIHISGEAIYKAPERNYSKQEVPGRNGDLLIDLGNFKNIPISYPAFITDQMPERVNDFFNFAGSLTGYSRLEDTYYPEEYRLAHYTGGIEVTASGYKNRSGEFTINFDCKPQRFLKSGEKTITFNSAGAIINPTRYNSQPSIRVYGSGTGAVGIGDYTITITSLNGYMDIDCEMMNAYKGTLNCNSQVTFSADNIFLISGSNGINFSGGITKVEIMPRWYKI